MQPASERASDSRERGRLERNQSQEAGGSVQPARLYLPLLDPQVARELGIVAAYLVE
jgi:hypothetical protein